MSDFTFTIPGNPPTLNDTYTIVYQGARCPTCGRGQPRLGKKGHVETWQTEVAWLAKTARPSGWTPARRTIIEVEWYTLRAHDSDAGIKALADGIAHGLGCDDRGFLTRAMRNEVDKTSPRTIVMVTNDHT